MAEHKQSGVACTRSSLPSTYLVMAETYVDLALDAYAENPAGDQLDQYMKLAADRYETVLDKAVLKPDAKACFEAAMALSTLYLFGLGCKQEKGLAAAYAHAALRYAPNSITAQYRLGLLMMNGHGLKMNLDQAKSHVYEGRLMAWQSATDKTGVHDELKAAYEEGSLLAERIAAREQAACRSRSHACASLLGRTSGRQTKGLSGQVAVCLEDALGFKPCRPAMPQNRSAKIRQVRDLILGIAS